MPSSTLLCQKLLRWLTLFFFCLATAHTAQGQWAEALPGTPITKLWKTIIDPAGNVTVAGEFFGTLTIGTTTLTSQGWEDLFVARRSAAGIWEWAVAGGGPMREYFTGLVLLPNGDVCIAGECNMGSFGPSISALFDTTTLTGEQPFLAKLTPGGQWGGVNALSLSGAVLNSVALEPSSGDVLVSGTYAGTNVTIGTLTLAGYSRGVFAGRMSADGQWRWVEPASGNSISSYYGTVSSDGSGGLIMIGFVYDSMTFGAISLNTTGSDAAFIAHLTAGRVWEWAKLIECPGPEAIFDHTIDTAGNIYLTGLFEGTVYLGTNYLVSLASSKDMFVAKLDNQGQWQWAKGIGGYGEGDFGTSICVDSGGSVYVGGTFQDTTFVGPRLLGAGLLDGAVLRLSANGNFDAAASLGGTGDDYVSTLAINPLNGHVVVGGAFDSPTLTLDPSHTFTHTGGSSNFSSFVADFSSLLQPLATAKDASPTTLTLSPNPASGALWLTLPTKISTTTGTLLDGVGRTVRTFPLTGERTRLDIQGLAPGVYTVRVGAQTRRLVVE